MKTLDWSVETLGSECEPKCLFLNICSLLKVKNGLKASLALEGDLYAEDIDICVISETHLNHNVPDFAVGISNYTIYRRDRDCFANDNRKKGGVAIYVRNNLRVRKVTESDRYECIFLEIELPSKYNMLVPWPLPSTKSELFGVGTYGLFDRNYGYLLREKS